MGEGYRMPLRWVRAWALAGVLAGGLAAGIAQQRTPPDGADPKPFVGLAHTAIRVKDIAASQAFYEKLGFEKAFSAEKNGVVTQAFYKINDREFLEIYPQLGPDPAKEPIGFMHLCFDGKDLEALHTHYLNEGLQPIAVRKAGMGNLLFTLRGPEGQNIEYTQYMPDSKHTLDKGQHLGPNRISDEMYGVALGIRDLPSAMTFYKEKLGFGTLPGRGDVLVIPGSTEEIYLFSSDGDTRSRTYFAVADVGKTAAELKRRGLGVKRSKGEATVTDPDGNLVMFRADRTMP
jgi:catechol 2,3-dioxygenase-like lactoylglutathione lyase family enzyme